ncbi:MAG TPA: chondroitinase-B domain-containing protein, partial [Kofleriaceae bacterium]
MRGLVAACMLVAPAAYAGVINVSTPGELAAAITNATAGDEIVLAAGTYPLTGATCAATGTPAEPIVVRAAAPLGARIEFDGLEGFKVTGAHWHFEDLDIRGVCAIDANCEHAFHVTGAAHGFVLRRSRVADFNAQLKVNASLIGSTWVTPNQGLVEYSEIGDTRGRATSNPVTKLNIDTGDDWVVRGNYLHDAQKIMGDGVSYAAFLKSGGKRGLFERNLVICSRDTTGGTRIGLSFGGGGTAPQFCAP